MLFNITIHDALRPNNGIPNECRIDQTEAELKAFLGARTGYDVERQIDQIIEVLKFTKYLELKGADYKGPKPNGRYRFRLFVESE